MLGIGGLYTAHTWTFHLLDPLARREFMTYSKKATTKTYISLNSRKAVGHDVTRSRMKLPDGGKHNWRDPGPGVGIDIEGEEGEGRGTLASLVVDGEDGGNSALFEYQYGRSRTRFEILSRPFAGSGYKDYCSMGSRSHVLTLGQMTSAGPTLDYQLVRELRISCEKYASPFGDCMRVSSIAILSLSLSDTARSDKVRNRRRGVGRSTDTRSLISLANSC